MAREEEEDAAAAPPAATAPVPETSEANSCGSVLGGGESTSMVAGGLCGRRAAGSLETRQNRWIRARENVTAPARLFWRERLL